MTESNLQKELGKLWLDFRWLQAKLNRTDINFLLHDYLLVFENRSGLSIETTNALSLIQDSLRLSAHVFVRDKGQLAGQLLGRLLSFEEPKIYSLVEQINQHKNDRPWLRPLKSCLKSPGGAEILT